MTLRNARSGSQRGPESRGGLLANESTNAIVTGETLLRRLRCDIIPFLVQGLLPFKDQAMRRWIYALLGSCLFLALSAFVRPAEAQGATEEQRARNPYPW